MMSSRDAAPLRRRITVVGALKKSLRRATHSTEGRTAAGRNSSASAASIPSSALPQRSSPQSGSTSSLGGLTRSSSTADVVVSPSQPLPPQHHPQHPQQQQQQGGGSQREPRLEALPTPDFYERFPRAVGPMANVVIATAEEYTMFCLTARRIVVVTRPEERDVAQDRLLAEDVARGGFFIYQPSSAAPEYFLLHEEQVTVYGTASYILR